MHAIPQQPEVSLAGEMEDVRAVVGKRLHDELVQRPRPLTAAVYEKEWAFRRQVEASADLRQVVLPASSPERDGP